MNNLIAMTSEMTMSTLDFLSEVINPAREQANETPHEPRKFLAKVEDELDLDATGKKFRLNSNQTESAYYDLSMDQLMLVGMRESKLVRVSVLSKLKAMSKPAIPQTYAAALLEAGRLALELEQSQQQLAIAAPQGRRVRQGNGARNAAQRHSGGPAGWHVSHRHEQEAGHTWRCL